MTLDVLKLWEDVLGFDPEDYVSMVEEGNHNTETWTVTLKNKRVFRMPHHRTTGYAYNTAEAIRAYTVLAREYWLALAEGRVARDEWVIENFIFHVSAALHLVQDFCMWSNTQYVHDIFEQQADKAYKEIREKLLKKGKKYTAGRDKIYNTYWTLTDGELTTVQADDPYRYVKEAFKRSSELLSYILSERKISRYQAENMLNKYGEYPPEKIEEASHWDLGGGYLFVRLVGAFLVIPATIIYTLITNPSIKGFMMNMLWAGIPYIAFMVITYILCKIADFKKRHLRYDMLADAAELMAQHYRNRYFAHLFREESPANKQKAPREDCRYIF